MFVPLHVKSDFSLGYGTASVDQLVERAAELGYRSLALTDLENLYGQVRFHDRCRRHGVRPITGVELRPGFDARQSPGSKKGRVVLLARDECGYRSLCRIVSCRRGGLDGGKGGPLDDPLPLVARYPEGLIALSDDPAVIERLHAGGSFAAAHLGLLLVRPAGLPVPDVPVSRGAGGQRIRKVADLDAAFAAAGDRPLHLLQLAVAQGRLIKETAGSGEAESGERWLRSAEDAASLFADRPDALAATEELAGMCGFRLGGDDETAHVFDASAAGTDDARLRRRCEEALAGTGHLRGGKAKRYRDRLAHELSVISVLGFSGFMLLVAEILGHCTEEGIPAAVRGSAVSSLVLHLLGGSPVDPVAQGLLFERFLHPGKSAWPDVDVDLSWHRRDEVIDWVYRHFGADKVAMVAAMHTFRHRSALREGLKALGIAGAVIERLSRAIPSDDAVSDELDAVETAAGSVAAEFDFLDVAQTPAPRTPALSDHLHSADPVLARALPLVRRLVGRPRHLAAHPGGIVIGAHPLADLVHLERAPKGVVVTQYDLVSVARLGLVKIDLLGNRCLSEIDEALAGAGWEVPLRIASIPREDPATLAAIDSADTLGCFQLESPAMRSLLARLPIRRQSDLTAALALIRPGASAGEVKESFVRRARGEEAATLAFPALADRLGETFGLPIYEEDIMVLLSRTGGISLAQADELRRGIVKCGGDAAALRGLQAAFLRLAKQAAPRASLARANRAWGVAARFAAYAFNKAHAASYAFLSYYAAYVKVHLPVQFASALLNHHQGLYPLRVEAAALLRMGVELLPPQVNLSGYRTRVEAAGAGRGAVRTGLDKVRGLSESAALRLVDERGTRGAFRSLSDLLARVRLKSNEVKALVLSGACDGLAPLTPSGYPFIHQAALDMSARGCSAEELDSLSAQSRAGTEAEKARLRLYQGLARAKHELYYLEMHLSAHPMELLREEAGRHGCLAIRDAVAAARQQGAGPHPPPEGGGTPGDVAVGGRAVEDVRLSCAERAAQAPPPSRGGAGWGSGVRIAAVVAAMRRIPTRQGTMQFVTLEDETGLLEAVVFPAVYRRIGDRVLTPGPFLVEGIMRAEQGAVHLEVVKLEPFHERSTPFAGRDC